MTYLAEQGILALGIIRQNMIPYNKMPSEKDLKGKERGTSIEMTAHVNNIEISCVIWKDNKLVTLMSTFAGQQPIMQATKFHKKKKQDVQIDCPVIVKYYNKHMQWCGLVRQLSWSLQK